MNKTTKKQSPKPDLNLTVTQADLLPDGTCPLLDFLYRKLDSLPKGKVKSHLEHKEILVGGKVSTKFNHPLKAGQVVTLRKNAVTFQSKETPLTILYEDADIIVIDKPAGLLSMANDKEKENTAYHMLTDYVRQGNQSNRIFIVHRLDRETSGVLMVAKNEKMKLALQDNWAELVSYRGYLAIVEGQLEVKTGQMKSWLLETKTHLMYSSSTPGDGLEAITNYEVISDNRDYSLVSVWLDTGRKNQIRVHMKDMEHPIAGDKKYGAQTNPARRLLLHAHKLVITHPFTREVMTFESNFEKSILKLARPQQR